VSKFFGDFELLTVCKCIRSGQIVDYQRGRGRVYLDSERFEGRAEDEDFTEEIKKPSPAKFDILFFRTKTENKEAKVRL